MDNRKVKTNDIIKGLYDAEVNWVILRKGKAICWEDGNPKVYPCVSDLMEDYNKKTDTIITEYAYIMQELEKDKPEW